MILTKFNNGMERMRALYEASMEEYDSDAQEEYREKLDEMTQRVEDAWRLLIEERVAALVEGFSIERKQRMQEVDTIHGQVQHLVSQLQSHKSLLSEIHKNQEFQKSFISMQSHIMHGQPLREDIDRLVNHRRCDYV